MLKEAAIILSKIKSIQSGVLSIALVILDWSDGDDPLQVEQA